MDFIDLKTQYARLRERIDARMQAVLDHGQYIMGPEIKELESALAARIGSRHAITVSSGTEALLISLMALGIGRGDEVITTPFTFAATAETIALLGATPVFVDIEPDTCNIDARRIEAAVTPATRAIMPVSLYGQVSDMAEINAVAEKHGLAVIEDAAQSFGAIYRGAHSGALSNIGCTSFFPSKPLGCYGDGGAIFTDDDDLALAMREIRVHGQERRYYHSRIGVGGRMDTLQCAVVLAKLEVFDQEIEARKAAGQRYLDAFSGHNGITSPVVRDDRTCVWAQFTIQIENRDAVAERLREKGIPTAVHYPVPLHRQPAYTENTRVAGTLGEAENVSARVLSLPLHPYITEDDQARVVDAVLDAMAS